MTYPCIWAGVMTFMIVHVPPLRIPDGSPSGSPGPGIDVQVRRSADGMNVPDCLDSMGWFAFQLHHWKHKLLAVRPSCLFGHQAVLSVRPSCQTISTCCRPSSAPAVADRPYLLTLSCFTLTAVASLVCADWRNTVGGGRRVGLHVRVLDKHFPGERQQQGDDGWEFVVVALTILLPNLLLAESLAYCLYINTASWLACDICVSLIAENRFK